MRHVDFDPTTLTGEDRAWWDTWALRAKAATEAVIDDWEDGRDLDFVKHSCVWKDLKNWLLPKVFDGKCAYCETRGARFSSDAEHFRPKGRVDSFDRATERWNRVKVEWPDGRIETHPGYFWLAFHWMNLVPACEKCNSGTGKQNKFPLHTHSAHCLVPKLTAAQARTVAAGARESVKWPGRFYLPPEELDRLEQPALLHPYFDNPSEHIRFGRCGVIAAVEGSEKGRMSIKTFNLDDPNLTVDRQRQQENAEMKYRMNLMAAIGNREILNPFDTALGALADFRAGKEAYSAAALDYIEILRTQLQHN